MAHSHREHQLPEWPGFALPERWRRLLGVDPEQGGWLRTEEYRDGDTLVFRSEAPGIDPEKDVEISVGGGALSVRVHREMREEQKNKRGYRSEFHYGELSRTIRLPEGASANDIQATYDNGILEIRVPIPGGQEPELRTIPVTKR